MKKFVKVITAALACVLMAFCLTACVPGNVEKGGEKMLKKGYLVDEEILTVRQLQLYEVEVDKAVLGFCATGESANGYEKLYVFYFDEKEDAEEYFYNYVLVYRDIYRWERTDFKGKVVMYGSNKAYEDFAK